MTIDESLTLIHAWLRTWRPGQVCEYIVPEDQTSGTFPCGERFWGGSGWLRHEPHEILMPPIKDTFIIRVINQGKLSVWYSLSNKTWQAHAEGGLTVSADNHRNAVILAAGQWLMSTK